jgi:hypothetical protein
MIIVVAIVCLFSGAAFGYLIAERQSQHAILAAKAKGLIEGRRDGLWEHHNMFQELQHLRARNRHLEANERIIRVKGPFE